eukprot:scaffold240586_cov31-Tisochrysis_lutea.AAC.1
MRPFGRTLLQDGAVVSSPDVVDISADDETVATKPALESVVTESMLREEERCAPSTVHLTSLGPSRCQCAMLRRLASLFHSMLTESQNEVQKQQALERRNLKYASKKDKVRPTVHRMGEGVSVRRIPD